MKPFPESLPPDSLRWIYEDSGSLSPETEDDGNRFIGQERAERALEFGLAMRGHDFNIFIAGPPGSGRQTMCRSICESAARHRPVPNSIVFVQNFTDPERPVWLIFPTGLGRAFCGDMAALITELRDTIPKAFEDETQENRRKEIVDSAQSLQRELFSSLETQAKNEGFAIRPAQTGFALIPLLEGEPATEENYEKLPSEKREEIDKKRMIFAENIGEFAKKARTLEKEVREKIRSLEQEIALTVVKSPIDDLKQKYRDYPKVIGHLDAVQEHILKNLDNFRPQDGGGQSPAIALLSPKQAEEDPFKAYQANLIVDNSHLDSAPVIFETNPTFNNLFGSIERKTVFGSYTTDFTLVRSGSMMQASGGFLILNALDALTNPGVWPALKRSIRTRSVRIEDLGEMYGWTHGGLKPEPVPVNVKVILMGSPMIYYLLLHHDEDFGKLFKIKADFNTSIKRNPETLRDFRGFIEYHRKESDLLPFSEDAVARIIERSARLVAHKEKLSARFGELRDLILEADHWARRAGSNDVLGKHIARAIEEKRYRSNLMDERLRELIAEGTLMIDVEGEVVGQVNGLAVLDLGDYSFGKPSRITAQTFMGEKGVINVERESKLSGSIHDKGVLILQGYLGATYAQNRPMALSASITFEQSYSGVDGDSASSTELYAILSSLSELPIRQGLAVTGSVNQRGEIQPIGGVNEKIEGFFEVCQEKGPLTGDQGVLIPHQNVRNLMLRDDVVDAVAEGKFHIYPIRTVDEGVSLLTGTPAGEPDPETGAFPPDTVHGKVIQKLADMHENLMRLRRGRRDDGEEEENNQEAAPEKTPPEPENPPPPPPRRKPPQKKK